MSHLLLQTCLLSKESNFSIMLVSVHGMIMESPISISAMYRSINAWLNVYMFAGCSKSKGKEQESLRLLVS